MNFKRLLITAGAIFVFALLAGILVDLNQYVMYPIPASSIRWGKLLEFYSNVLPFNE